jgi:hypothetical protein
VLGGDFENDDGTGGHSAYEEKYFLAEQCPLKVCTVLGYLGPAAYLTYSRCLEVTFSSLDFNDVEFKCLTVPTKSARNRSF